jgi:putative glycosyltransferase (TIGR04372 family)
MLQKLRSLGLSRRSLFILAVFLPVILPCVLLIRLSRRFVTIRFGALLCCRLGHLAFESEMYLCERDAGLQKVDVFDIFYLEQRPVCNRPFVAILRRQLRIWNFVYPLDKINRLFPGAEAHVVPLLTTNGHQDIHGLFDRIPSHLSFTQREEIKGKKELELLGVKDSIPFVCFHARDSAYLEETLKGGFEYHSFRDASIKNYLSAAEELAQRGYYTLRMGAVVKDELQTDCTRVIDYASIARTAFMDIYLGAKCSFFMVSGTGISIVPLIFRRPIVYVNIVPINSILYSTERDLWIPKKLWFRKEERYLSFQEIVEFGVMGFGHSEEFEREGFEVVENSAEEIRELAIEMDGRIKGTWVTSAEAEERQEKFAQIYRNAQLQSFNVPRVGAEFLRQNPELLQ